MTGFSPSSPIRPGRAYRAAADAGAGAGLYRGHLHLHLRHDGAWRSAQFCADGCPRSRLPRILLDPGRRTSVRPHRAQTHVYDRIDHSPPAASHANWTLRRVKGAQHKTGRAEIFSRSCGTAAPWEIWRTRHAGSAVGLRWPCAFPMQGRARSSFARPPPMGPARASQA